MSHFKAQIINILTGFGRYYGQSNGKIRKDAVLSHLQKLKQLQSWFKTQRKLSFIASSILLIYEGSDNENGKKCDNSVTNDVFNDNNFDSDNDSILKCESNASSIKPNDINKLDSLEGFENGELMAKKSKLEINQSDLNDLNSHSMAGTSQHSSAQSFCNTELRLIDFAHVYPSDKIDDNFLFGIEKLIDCLEKLIL